MSPAESATLAVMRRFGPLTRQRDGCWYPDGMRPENGGVAAHDAIVRALAQAGHVAIAELAEPSRAPGAARREVATLLRTRAAA